MPDGECCRSTNPKPGDVRYLKNSGWRVLTVWECSLKGKTRIEKSELAKNIIAWLTDDIPEYEITGRE